MTVRVDPRASGPTIAPDDPTLPEVAGLLEASEALAHALYPSESVHMLPIAALSGADVRFLVARDAGGEALGCAALVLDGAGAAEIKRMFVRAEARGRGLGAALLTQLETDARDLGVALIRLETGVRQPEAVRLYRRFGYRIRGPFAPYGPDPLSIFMEKRLEPGPCGGPGDRAGPEEGPRP
jgi:putative acetyltransferase